MKHKVNSKIQKVNKKETKFESTGSNPRLILFLEDLENIETNLNLNLFLKKPTPIESSEIIDKTEIVPTPKLFHQQNSSGPSKNDEERHCATDFEPKNKEPFKLTEKGKKVIENLVSNQTSSLDEENPGLKKTMMSMNYKKPIAEWQKLPSVSQRKKENLSDEAKDIYKNQVIDLKKQMEKQEEHLRREMEKQEEHFRNQEEHFKREMKKQEEQINKVWDLVVPELKKAKNLEVISQLLEILRKK